MTTTTTTTLFHSQAYYITSSRDLIAIIKGELRNTKKKYNEMKVFENMIKLLREKPLRAEWRTDNLTQRVVLKKESNPEHVDGG